jgi:hypothetical protein
MGIEAFAEATQCLCPGWRVESIEDVNFLAPFKFYRDEPRTVTVRTVIRSEGDMLVANCSLIGSRLLPNQTEPHETVHFTGRIRLSKQHRNAASGISVPQPKGSMIEAGEIYRVYFHGPAYQVVKRAWRDGDRIIGEIASDLPANHHPPELATVIAPRLIELCFQTAGLWEMGVEGRMGLPLHVDEIRAGGGEDERVAGPLFAVVTPCAEQKSFSAQVVDSMGRCLLDFSGYRTVAIPADQKTFAAIQAIIGEPLVTA